MGPIDAPESVVNAARVIAAMRTEFLDCYVHALNAAPDTRASVSFTLRVDAAGAVTFARAASDRRLPPELSACLEARASAALFTRPSEARPAEVRFRVRLEPG
jgi:hypothetical protein